MSTPNMNGSSPFERIPVELLKPIFHFLNPWELIPVLQTCKGFLEAGRSLLYEKVDIIIYHMFLLNSSLNPISRHFLKIGSVDGDPHSSIPPRASYKHGEDLKKYNWLELFARLAQTESGRLVSELKITSEDDFGAIAYAHCIDTTDPWPPFVPEAPMAALLDNISEERLTSLTIEYSWLPWAHKLTSLRSLTIEAKLPDLDAPPIDDNLHFPSLNTLSLVWTQPSSKGGAINTFRVESLTSILCCLLRRFTTISALVIDENTFGDHGRAYGGVINTIGQFNPEYISDILEVTYSLTSPRLSDIRVSMNKSWLHQPFGESASNRLDPFGITSTHQILASFLNRHMGQLKTVKWFGVYGAPLEMRDDIISILPFPAAEDLHLSVEKTALPTPKSEIEWLDNLAAGRLRPVGVEVKRLCLSLQPPVSGDILPWVSEFVIQFEHLTTLHLDGLVVDPCGPFKKYSFEEICCRALGATSMKESAERLPVSLRKLTLGFLVAKTFGASPLSLFQKLSVDLFRERHYLHTAVFELTRSPRDLFETRPRLVVMRRPTDYNMPDTSKDKKLCIWSIDNIHGQGKNGTPHPFLSFYSEILLPSGRYRGPDRPKWSWDKQDIIAIRKCLHNGVGGCDHLLMSKGFWVPALS